MKHLPLDLILFFEVRGKTVEKIGFRSFEGSIAPRIGPCVVESCLWQIQSLMYIWGLGLDWQKARGVPASKVQDFTSNH